MIYIKVILCELVCIFPILERWSLPVLGGGLLGSAGENVPPFEGVSLHFTDDESVVGGLFLAERLPVW